MCDAWYCTDTTVVAMLEDIQLGMLERARKERDEHLSVVTEWKDFIPALDKRNLVLAPWCETTESEEWVKKMTGPQAEEAAGGGGDAEDAEAAEEAARSLTGAAKTLCIPFNQPAMPDDMMCFTGNGKKATAWTLWGRSY